jgi:hypothetical protein
MRDKLIQEVLRSKLLMGYDLSKTYSDNLNEQNPVWPKESFMTDDQIKANQERQKKEKEQEIANTYPNYCDYPDNTVAEPDLCDEIKHQGELIKKSFFCFYPGMYGKPGGNKEDSYGRRYHEEYKTGIGAYAIPKGAKIDFQTLETITAFKDKIINETPKVYDNDIIKNELELRLMEIIPLGSIKSFKLSTGDHYVSQYTLKSNMDPTEWEFNCYINKATNKCWVNPECQDKRNERQKFLDNWGTLLQVGVAIGTVVAGFFTEGATWLLLPEVLTELGLGILMGHREWEKGQNVGAAISFITGLLPLMKYSKTFRGISTKGWTEISDKLKNRILKSEDDLKDFYMGLSDDGKKAWNIIVRQDELGRAVMAEELVKALGDEFDDVIFLIAKDWFAKNPDQVVRIEFFRRLWVREMGSNLDVMIAGLLTDVVFGDKLNDPEKLKYVIFNIPIQNKKDVAENMVRNSVEINNEFLKRVPQQAIDSIKQSGKDSLNMGVQRGLTSILTQAMEDSGGKWKTTYGEKPLPEIDLDLPETGEDVQTQLKEKGYEVILMDDVQKYNIPDSLLQYKAYQVYIKKEDKLKYINVKPEKPVRPKTKTN